MSHLHRGIKWPVLVRDSHSANLQTERALGPHPAPSCQTGPSITPSLVRLVTAEEAGGHSGGLGETLGLKGVGFLVFYCGHKIPPGYHWELVSGIKVGFQREERTL